ncbi:LysR family transcriptional regulator [Trinickia fusca]|uniref:LysR family transcriptional regulator n=2 Tax=Trinickia fusca TaxID=2419777 RepID=A0A494WZA6_9BURK|nr:LysR family transcriptional regulator [Trinickia fusca]
MDIRQLKAFIAVFEERSITAAAQRLFLAQPTLSVTIRQLEEEMGVALFNREARGVRVSEAARLLYPQARQLVEQADSLKRLFRQDGRCLLLTLGIEADLGPKHIEQLLKWAQQASPLLLLSVVQGCAGDARLAAEDSRCEDELFLPLWEEPFVLVSPAGAPTDDWVICPDHPSHQRLLPLYGGRVECAARAGSLMLARHMVAAGLGRAWLPVSLAQGDAGVRVHETTGPSLMRRVGLCYAAQALSRPGLQALHGYLQSLNVDVRPHG